jgi:RHS repeat-associated protein
MARVSQTIGSWATLYPHPGYSITGTTSTTYLAGPLGNTASLDVTPTSTTLTFFHTDHLGSTSLTTDTSGILEELFDYTPYGARRLHEGTTTQVKTFLGEYSDPSGLSYLNARYYSPVQGRFISQDSAFWSGEYIALQLIDPQSWNSYSYARGNPVVLYDPKGNFPAVAALIGAVIAGVFLQEIHTANSVTTNTQPICSVPAPDRGRNIVEVYSPEYDALPGAVKFGAEVGVGIFVGSVGTSLPGKAAGVVEKRVAKKSLGTIATEMHWGKSNTLIRHARDHAPDFGLDPNDIEGYAQKATTWMQEALGDAGVWRKTDKNGSTLMYDPIENIFGAFDKNWGTKTFYKPDAPNNGYPTNIDYWEGQRGDGW